MERSVCIIVLSLVYVFAFVSYEHKQCSIEKRNEVETVSEGQINPSSLKLAVNVNANVATHADIDTKNYIIRIHDCGNDNKLVREWRCSETSEISPLKTGNYTAAAFSYDVLPAEFKHSYYYGKEDFGILKNQITDIIDLQCVLCGVMVIVEYGEKLLTLLGNDVKANVILGQGPPDFVKDGARAGYYQVINENTNVITIHPTGATEGESVDISKGFSQVKAGVHKVIRYTLKDVDENSSSKKGNAGISIRIDVTCIAIEQDIIVDSDGDIVPDEPDESDNPDNPSEEQPTIKGDGFNISRTIVSPETTSPDNPYSAMVSIVAVSGITNLKITIDSDVLDGDVLADVGLKKDFGLARPEELKDVLEGPGFPVGEDVAGRTELIFNIIKFTGLLTMLNPDTHNFIITVVDTKNSEAIEASTLVQSN